MSTRSRRPSLGASIDRAAACAALCLALTVTGSVPCLAQSSLPESGAPTNAYEYVIWPNDVLEIAVWNNVAITRTVPVRPDGKISLPLLNDVQAAGLTPMELQRSLTKALARYLQPPEVSVIVREVHNFKVSVIGEVKASGRFELTGPITVLDVLALAGGFNDFANRGGVVVLRRVGSTTKRILFAYDTVKSGKGSGSERENFLVQPNDIVLVP